MAAHLSWLIREKEPTWLTLGLLRAEVFTQQPEHPEQVCLEEWGTNVWAKGGLDSEAGRLTGRLKQIVLGSKHIVLASACLCSAKRHLQSLDHDGCNLLCWNFSIHRLTVQCRKIIYLMCTYLLQCPSNRLPFPFFSSALWTCSWHFPIAQRSRKPDFVRWLPKCNTFN